jgi:copper chaperone CopZ
MSENKNIELKISGMACAGCSAAVERALSRLDGVNSARVDLGRKTAYIDYNPAKLTEQDFKRAVEMAGYKVD